MAGKRKANGEGTIFQRLDGRWQAAGYVLTADGTQKRVFVYGATRKEAADKLGARLTDSHRGMVVAKDAQLTVGVYLADWLTTVARHRIRVTTYATYENLTTRYLIPGLGQRKLGTLTVKDVRMFLDRLATVCQCCAWGWDAAKRADHPVKARRPRCCAVGNCCHKTLKPDTVRYIRAILSAALAHGVREDMIGRNVASAVRLPMPRSEFQPFTAGEARKYLLAAAYHRHGALYELALRTGLRRGELLGLHWTDIDLDSGHLYVQRTLARTKGGPTFLPTKTYRSARRIILPRECVASLKRYQARQHIDQREAGEKWKGLGLVFANPTGGPLEAATVHRNHQVLCEVAEVRYIKFHGLRHTCATLLLEQGVELIAIKELLGHAQIHTTADIYSHVRVRMQRDAIESMAGALDAAHDDEQHLDGEEWDEDPDDPDDPPLAAALV